MAQATPFFTGVLRADREIPVKARYASRYSLWLDLPEQVPACRDFEGLTLNADERTIELGACSTVVEEVDGETRIRLIPRESIYDFEKLFFRGRADMLESAAMNLPLILGYKNSIDTRFRDYVSELTYDLSAYKTLFDRLDVECENEPDVVRKTVQRGLLENLGPGLMQYLDEQLEELRQIVHGFSDKEHEHHGYYFRKQLWNIILCSPIMRRTNLKPRGYIGDSEMMRMIYDNDYRGSSTFGKIMHKHPVGQPAAQAVRNRRSDMARLLNNFVENQRGVLDERVKVLSVACGPAYELQEILRTSDDCRDIHYSLLDQDKEALLEAASVVEGIEARLSTKASVDFIRESVRTMLVTRELRERWGRFHFIYSMGLFDYLTPPVATAVMKKLYELLIPGGQMIIGNFHVQNPTMYYMAYWLDWSIIYRTEEDLLALAGPLKGADLSVRFDDTGIQMFLVVKKQVGDG
jgi:extracellular factor (EF) 3-hydroxypalmitic acid methyl ester biosynthesis protein